jgi:hypothetical protein
MTADGVGDAVRGQVGLGRLLPLGAADDGLWLAERAAVGVLAGARDAVAGARLARLTVGLVTPDGHDWHAVRAANPAAPPSALPAGPLRIAAELTAPVGQPIPRTADAVRAALERLASERLGLAVATVDLTVVDLVDPAAAPPPPDAEPVRPASAPVRRERDAAVGSADTARDAALTVPGVTAAASRTAPGGAARLEITMTTGHRARDVAAAVRDAAAVDAVVVVAIG